MRVQCDRELDGLATGCGAGARVQAGGLGVIPPDWRGIKFSLANRSSSWNISDSFCKELKMDLGLMLVSVRVERRVIITFDG